MTSVLVVLLAANLAVVTWVYAGYPLFLVVMSRLKPSPRIRQPLVGPISVIIAAHNEEHAIESTIANVFSSDYPRTSLEIVVASDGSTDGTVAVARRAGATQVIDLPRVGKIRALTAAANAGSGDVLVFTDADSTLEPETLRELMSNFADPNVGGVSGNQITRSAADDGGVARGEGLYWKYEHWIKRLEDRVGSTVSAAGGLYAVRRELFALRRSSPEATTFSYPLM